MKKALCLFISFSLVTGALKLHAQQNEDTTRLLLSDKIVLSGFGSPFVEFSSVDQEFAVCLGGGRV